MNTKSVIRVEGGCAGHGEGRREKVMRGRRGRGRRRGGRSPELSKRKTAGGHWVLSFPVPSKGHSHFWGVVIQSCTSLIFDNFGI